MHRLKKKEKKKEKRKRKERVFETTYRKSIWFLGMKWGGGDEVDWGSKVVAMERLVVGFWVCDLEIEREREREGERAREKDRV